MRGLEVRQPSVVAATSPHGAELHVAPLPTVPLAQAYLAYRVSVSSFAELAPLEAFQAHWMATQRVAAFQREGGTAYVSRNQHWVTFGASGQRELLQRAVDLVCSAAHPVEVTPEQAQRAAAKARLQAQSVAARPASVTQQLVLESLYGDVPPLLATQFPPGMWDGVSETDVGSWGTRHSTGAPAHLVLCGDLDCDHALVAGLAALEKTGAGATEHPRPLLPEARTDPAPGGAVPTEHTRRGWAVAHLRSAYPAIEKADELFPASLVALAALGYFSGRINRSVRERLGLAYRTDASLGQHLDRDMAFVEADVGPLGVEEADAEIASILRGLVADGISGDELDAVITYITGQYTLALSSQSGLALAVLSFVTTGLSVPEISGLPGRIRAVTADAVVEAASRIFDPGPAAKVVVRPAVAGPP